MSTYRKQLRNNWWLLLLASLYTPVRVGAQTLAGHWVMPGDTLDNGEKTRMVLHLETNGTAVSGEFFAMGWSQKVSGTVKDDQFQLFSGEEKRPFFTGRAAQGELQAVLWGNKVIAKPATASTDLPGVPYITPPPLHDVAENGLAKTPPMGWNSWNLFAGKIDEETVRTMADAMVTSGMRDAGYIYVNIDDSWQGVRDAEGNLQPNHKFPDMKALADYVHSKGLKLGIYSSPGPRTCAGYPGSYGHEKQDAALYAAWGIDYVKYDWCSASEVYQDAELQPVYQEMGAALAGTGRRMVYSLCEYGLGAVQTWGTRVGGNLWRTTGDIRDEWTSMRDNITRQIPTAPYAGPGHWNDPDMLEVGNGHMTEDEYRTHMSLWAVSAAPLLAGNDIRTMSAVTRSILLNKDVIAIDQDRLGKQGTPEKMGNLEMWSKPLAEGGVALALVNPGAAPVNAVLRKQDLTVHGAANVRDVWAQQDIPLSGKTLTRTIPSHGVLLLRVSPAETSR